VKTAFAPQSEGAVTSSPFHNILVAVDPACATENLLAVAAGLGRDFGAKISLLHVIPEDRLDIADPAERVSMRAAGEHGVRRCADLMEIHHQPCHTLLEVGDIVAEVGKAVRQRGYDLVIVGSAQLRNLEKLRIGSVAEGIFRSVTCPVLTVGPQVPHRLGQVEFRKVVMPVAFDIDIHAACRQVEPLLTRWHSHVVVLHTLPGARRYSPDASRLAAEYQQRLEKTMPCSGKPFAADYQVKFGDPVEAILNVAHAWEADLIALPVRRGGRLISHLPGHIAYQVIRRAPCPVLTVRV
jgi:nucleotide-binding universal stress UspA family protein